MPGSRSIFCLIGGGKSGKEGFEAFTRVASVGKMAKHTAIMCMNSSLAVYSRPHYWLVADWQASEKYGDMAREAQRYGTRIMAGPKIAKDYEACDILEYDVKNKYSYSKTRIAHGRSIGVIAIQIALRLGARQIHLCGYEGYALDNPGGCGTFSDRQSQEHWYEWCREMNFDMSVVLRQILFENYKDVTFTCWGRSLLFMKTWPIAIMDLASDSA